MKEIKMINKNQEEQEEQEMEIPKMKSNKLKNYELVQIPTQHSLAVQTPEGEILRIDNGEILVEILNKVNRLERGMIG